MEFLHQTSSIVKETLTQRMAIVANLTIKCKNNCLQRRPTTHSWMRMDSDSTTVSNAMSISGWGCFPRSPGFPSVRIPLAETSLSIWRFKLLGTSPFGYYALGWLLCIRCYYAVISGVATSCATETSQDKSRNLPFPTDGYSPRLHQSFSVYHAGLRIRVTSVFWISVSYATLSL